VEDGLHIPIWNRIKKPLAIALSKVARGLRGNDDRDNVNNVQCKSNWNCHYEFRPPYSEYILINFLKKYFVFNYKKCLGYILSFFKGIFILNKFIKNMSKNLMI
jgi:hypothetical protein